jgi:DNA-binding transcriptional MerR regulator
LRGPVLPLGIRSGHGLRIISHPAAVRTRPRLDRRAGKVLQLPLETVKKEASSAKLFKDEKSRTKLVYKFDEVSRLTGVDVATLAAWEEDFPFLAAGLTGSGEKFFRQQDVAIVARIQELMAAKTLTMAGIKRRIEDEFGLARSAPIRPERLRKTLTNVRDELQDIVSVLDGGRKKKP